MQQLHGLKKNPKMQEHGYMQSQD